MSKNVTDTLRRLGYRVKRSRTISKPYKPSKNEIKKLVEALHIHGRVVVEVARSRKSISITPVDTYTISPNFNKKG